MHNAVITKGAEFSLYSGIRSGVQVLLHHLRPAAILVYQALCYLRLYVVGDVIIILEVAFGQGRWQHTGSIHMAQHGSAQRHTRYILCQQAGNADAAVSVESIMEDLNGEMAQEELL